MLKLKDITKQQIKIAEIVFIIIVVLIIIIYEVHKRNKIKNNGVTTYAVVYDWNTDGSNMYTYYYYNVGDSVYKGGIGGNFYVPVGDTFSIRYLKTNPKEVTILKD